MIHRIILNARRCERHNGYDDYCRVNKTTETYPGYGENYVKNYSYDKFGRQIHEIFAGYGVTIENRYHAVSGARTNFITDRGFTGHRHLDNIGIIDMNARMYDPILGQFISPDPIIKDIGLALNHNSYIYCLNNPLLYTDPTGMYCRIHGGNCDGTCAPLEIGQTYYNWDDEKYYTYQGMGWVDGEYVMLRGESSFDNLMDEINSSGDFLTRWDNLGENEWIRTDNLGEMPLYGNGRNLGTTTAYVSDLGAYFIVRDAYRNIKGAYAVGVGSVRASGQGGVASFSGANNPDGKVNSFSFNFAFGGGFGFEIGTVTDRFGGKKWFYSGNANIGYGLGAGFSERNIYSVHGHNFTVKDYKGFSQEFSWGIYIVGGSYGGNKNQWEFDGFGDFGYKYIEESAGVSFYSPGPIVGGFFTISETKFF